MRRGRIDEERIAQLWRDGLFTPHRFPEPVCPVRLQRGPVARLRHLGLLELLSYLVLLSVVFVINDLVHGRSVIWGSGTDVLGLLAFWLGALAVRVAVYTEYLECDEQEIRWRSLFRRQSIPWSDVAELDSANLHLFISRFGEPALRVHRVSGRRPRIRASVWCRPHWKEWMQAAMVLWARSQATRSLPPPEADGPRL